MRQLTWKKLLELPVFKNAIEQAKCIKVITHISFLSYLNSTGNIDKTINSEIIANVIQALSADIRNYPSFPFDDDHVFWKEYQDNILKTLKELKCDLEAMQNPKIGIEAQCVQIIKKNIDEFDDNSSSDTLLISTIKSKNIKEVQFLLEIKGDHDQERAAGKGYIPINLVLWSCNLDMISLLIQQRVCIAPDLSFLRTSSFDISWTPHIGYDYVSADTHLTYLTLNATQKLIQEKLKKIGESNSDHIRRTENLLNLTEYLKIAEQSLKEIFQSLTTLLIPPLAQMVFAYIEMNQCELLGSQLKLVDPSKILTSHISLTNHYALYERERSQTSKINSTVEPINHMKFT